MRLVKVLSAALFALLISSAASLAGPGIGDPAPNFCEPDTTGVSHCLSHYQGDVILLNFWWSG